MANNKSALKDIRQSRRACARNKSDTSTMRTFIKKVGQAVEAGDVTQAQASLREAYSIIAATAGKGVIHKRQAARRMSRLNAKVKAIALAKAA
ncbi:MAG: 30S ribosomal protein S20 [Magnetococcales bacterium]|nr:30S ribosomal protein S20 [Magnetococcales bacterium]